MNEKIKINIDTSSVTSPYKEVAKDLALNLQFVNEVFADFLEKNTLIKDYSSNGLIEIDVALVSDQEIQQLNFEYRNKNKSTDVISISMYENFRIQWIENQLPMVHLGDIFISLETAERQSKEEGISLLDELIELLIHGVLHLFGFDHEISEEEMDLMYQWERDIYDH